MSQLPFPDTFRAQFSHITSYSLVSSVRERELVARIVNKYLMTKLEPSYFSRHFIDMFNESTLSRQRELIVRQATPVPAFDYTLYQRLEIPQPHKRDIMSMLLVSLQPNYAEVVPLRELQRAANIKGSRQAVANGYIRKIAKLASIEPSRVATVVYLFADQLYIVKEMDEFLQSFYLASCSLIETAIAESSLSKATKYNVSKFFVRTSLKRRVHIQRIVLARSQLCMLHNMEDESFVLPVDARHIEEARFAATNVPDEFQFALLRLQFALLRPYTPKNGLVGTEF
ncbi:hypothetical protein SARC_03969 [Sphaeroforma arctica JP610]|uniref:Uncharacterized protein n=1 Tax=Sphaeroforma arctica JP610 TaxID=667725 RepID=A0A0L0G6E1_9EUKA|nr:hypothetical protein SARC_03969 [Sphaeroforma arctica JP610]KNC83793.1 hypothetical protein SARC_03969 [Sphaeroforma arctica JP610]|eukprot:XP_014157695.1 hypothetical protein SARC_03969 [Sphaeroforma arctica JP610]